MNLQVAWQRRGVGILIHSLLIRNFCFCPLGRVRKLYVNLPVFSDIHRGVDIILCIDLNHTVRIVEDIKVYVPIEEVFIGSGILPIFFHLPNKSP